MKRFFFGACVATLAACSVTSTPVPSNPDPGGTTPAPTTTATSPAPSASSTGTGSSSGDTPPPVDKTPFLTFTRDGSPETADPSSIKVTKTDDGWQIQATFPSAFPDSPPPASESTSSLTVSVKDKTQTVCTNSSAWASLLYQEPNGTITTASADQIEGSCAMSITRFGEDGLFEGSATGTLANTTFSRSWSFVVSWRQPAPQ